MSAGDTLIPTNFLWYLAASIKWFISLTVHRRAFTRGPGGHFDQEDVAAGDDRRVAGKSQLAAQLGRRVDAGRRDRHQGSSGAERER